LGHGGTEPTGHDGQVLGGERLKPADREERYVGDAGMGAGIIATIEQLETPS